MWRYLAFELRRGATGKVISLIASGRQEKIEKWSGQEGLLRRGKEIPLTQDIWLDLCSGYQSDKEETN